MGRNDYSIISRFYVTFISLIMLDAPFFVIFYLLTLPTIVNYDLHTLKPRTIKIQMLDFVQVTYECNIFYVISVQICQIFVKGSMHEIRVSSIPIID